MSQNSSNFGQIINSLRSSSGVNPALIFAALCLSGGISGAVFADSSYSILFGSVISIGVAVAAFQILFFTIFDRDRLHENRHVENKMMISRITPVLGDSENMIELTSDQIAIENPSAKGEGDA